MSTGVASRNSEVRRRLDAMCASRSAPGLQYLAVRGDEVLLEHCAGVADACSGRPVTPDTSFNVYSIAKPLTAAAVLALAEAGRLDLDAPIATACGLPALRAFGSVRDTLLHRAGFPNPLPLRWFHTLEEHASFDESAFVREQLDRLRSPRRWPWPRAGYSNLGYLALGMAIERAAGQRHARCVEQAVLAPLALDGRERLAYSISEPATHARGHVPRASWLSLLLGLLVPRAAIVDGAAHGWLRLRPHHVHGSAYGGLMANARGLVRFGQAVLGQLPGLSPGVRDAMLHIVPGPGPRRSLAWFSGTLTSQAWFAHAGGGLGYYAELRLYPELGMVSALLLDRCGLRDARLLDRIDRPWLEGLGTR